MKKLRRRKDIPHEPNGPHKKRKKLGDTQSHRQQDYLISLLIKIMGGRKQIGNIITILTNRRRRIHRQQDYLISLLIKIMGGEEHRQVIS
jgi:hypothetical protein